MMEKALKIERAYIDLKRNQLFGRQIKLLDGMGE